MSDYITVVSVQNRGACTADDLSTAHFPPVFKPLVSWDDVTPIKVFEFIEYLNNAAVPYTSNSDLPTTAGITE